MNENSLLFSQIFLLSLISGFAVFIIKIRTFFTIVTGSSSTGCAQYLCQLSRPSWTRVFCSSSCTVSARNINDKLKGRVHRSFPDPGIVRRIACRSSLGDFANIFAVDVLRFNILCPFVVIFDIPQLQISPRNSTSLELRSGNIDCVTRRVRYSCTVIGR